MPRRIQFINGYGVPSNLLDPAFECYLNLIYTITGMDPWSPVYQPLRVFLGGGFTNRGDITEAQFMESWFRRQSLRRTVSFIRLEQGITARQNLEELYRFVGDVPVTIFCEQSSELRMRFLASRFFSDFEVCGLRFEPAAARRFSYFVQTLVYTPLELLAWYIPFLYRLRLYLRLWRLRRIRSRSWS